MTTAIEGKMIDLVRAALNAHVLALPGIRILVEAYERGPVLSLDGDIEKARRRVWNLNAAFADVSGHSAFDQTDGGVVLTPAARTWMDIIRGVAEQQQAAEDVAVQIQADRQAVIQKLMDLGPDGIGQLIARVPA